MIASYVEQRHVFGGADPGKPAPGAMQVYCDDGNFGNADGIPMMVDFLCPCGCGNTCPTHLVTPRRDKKPNDHHWHFLPTGHVNSPNGPTLSPSIRWRSGCRSHFNITDGKVVWHGDTGR